METLSLSAGKVLFQKGLTVTLAEATAVWHAEAYAPLVDLIRSEGLVRAFPDRTESDLYVWILQHWELLRRKHGASYAARDAIRDFGRRNRRPIWRWLGALLRGPRAGGRGAPGSPKA